MPSSRAAADCGQHSELRSNWRLLLAATIGTGVGFPSVAYYTIGIFAPELAKTFGWSFASIFGGLTVIAGTLLIGSPIAGLLVDRYGGRGVATASLIGLGISYISLAASTGSLVQYYITWLFIGVSGVGATFVPFTKAVNLAFRKQRGLALGVTLAGTGLFILICKPWANWLLMRFGWRSAVVGIGLLPAVIGASAVWWGLPGKRVGLPPSHSSTHPTLEAPGLTLKDAARMRAFWLMIAILILISFASAAPFPNMENILHSVHVGTQAVIELTAWVGAMMIFGRLLGGWIMDRFRAPLVGAVFLLGAGGGSWLMARPAVTDAEAYAAISLLGMAAGLEGGLISFLSARYFGVRHYGAIYGLMLGIFAVGAAAGPGVFGYAYDRLGSYMLILKICAYLFGLAATLLLLMGPYPAYPVSINGPQRMQ